MATNKDIQNEINGILWKACDTFRGAVDPVPRASDDRNGMADRMRTVRHVAF